MTRGPGGSPRGVVNQSESCRVGWPIDKGGRHIDKLSSISRELEPGLGTAVCLRRLGGRLNGNCVHQSGGGINFKAPTGMFATTLGRMEAETGNRNNSAGVSGRRPFVLPPTGRGCLWLGLKQQQRGSGNRLAGRLADSLTD